MRSLLNARIKERPSMPALFRKTRVVAMFAASDKRIRAPACAAGGVCDR
jgi:hypothetical protein